MLESCLGCEEKLPPKPATQLIADNTDFPMKNVRPARLLNSYKLKSYLSRGTRLNSFSGVLSWKNFVLFFCIYSLTFIRYSEIIPARFAVQHFPILLPHHPHLHFGSTEISVMKKVPEWLKKGTMKNT